MKNSLMFFLPTDFSNLFDDDDDNDAWKDTKKWKEDAEGTCSKCGKEKKLLDTGMVKKHFYCPHCEP